MPDHPDFEILSARRWTEKHGLPLRLVLIRWFTPTGKIREYSTHVQTRMKSGLGIFHGHRFRSISSARGDYEKRELSKEHAAVILGMFGGKSKRLLGNPRPCPGHIPGECGADIHHERGCRMISWSKCPNNPTVSEAEHKTKRTAVYAARRNARITKAERGRRLR